MKRILVVANDSPYPLNYATAHDTWGHIQSLKNLGFKVDLVVTVNSLPPEEDIRVLSTAGGHVSIVERQRNWKAAVGVLPFQIRSRKGLETIRLEEEYEAVVLESEHVAAILKNPSLRAKRSILRLNNNEARFFSELSKSSRNLFLKAFHRVEAAKYRWLSPAIMSSCNALWFVSDYEMKEHLKKHPNHSGKSFFVPPRVEVDAMRRRSLQGQTVLFIGTLAFANNVRAVEWYVSRIHPSLCNIPGYSFVVAGNTRGGSNGAIAKLARSHARVSLHENPKDLESLYGNAAVFINPVFRGSGLKIKNIDAIRAGVPVVTTSIGVEGSGLIPGKHLLVADSEEPFEASVRTLLSNKHMAQEIAMSAQDFLAKEYDQERIIQHALARM